MPTITICALSVFLFLQSPGMFVEYMLPISIAVLVWQLTTFVLDLGKRVNVLTIITVSASVHYLFSPAMIYHLGDSEKMFEYINPMIISAERYFHVAFPGTIALIAGLNIPFKSFQIDHKERFLEIEEYLRDKTDTGINLFWVGVVCSLAIPFAPTVLSHPLVLGALLIYIGGLYLWYSDHPNRKLYVAALFIIPMVKSVKYGMFTELVNWGLFLVMLLLLKYRVRLYAKVAVMLVGITLLLFIQSIKYEYRLRTWFDESMLSLESKAAVFQDMLADRIAHPEMIVSKEVMFGGLERLNQGSLTAMAINYTPEYEPFAKGETIFTALAASFIPRVIWPDKPAIGGRESMKRFTGFEPMGNTSMDIGQLGDSYVNFGAWGGALFLFFYGVLFAFINAKLFDYSAKHLLPALLWIPLFFAGAVQVESSMLSTFSHIFKVAIFFFLVQWVFKEFLKIKL